MVCLKTSFFQNKKRCAEFKMYLNQLWLYAQLGFTCSKSPIETPEQCVKFAQS